MINMKGIKHYDYHHALFILQPLVHNTDIIPNVPVVGTPQSPIIVQKNSPPVSQDEIGPIVDTGGAVNKSIWIKISNLFQ